VRDVIPRNDRIVIQRIDDPEELSKGGILIPDTARKKSAQQRATVLAVGPGVLVDGRRIPLDLQPGDVVLIERSTGGYEMNIDGQDIIIMSEWQVHGKVPA
jgi:chaperonin GroES